jgi:hypothetical protein
LGVSILHSTDPSEVDRTIVFGFIPNSTLSLVNATPIVDTGSPFLQVQLGEPFSTCPWHAKFDAPLILSFSALITANITLTSATHAIACTVSLPPRRVSLGLTSAGLSITVEVESFLRAYDVELVLLNVSLLQSFFPNTTVLEVSREGQGYRRDLADPSSRCPAGYYYTGTGSYLPLPGHSTAGYDCFGFTCDPDYMLEQNLCVPTYVADWIYWTTVGLVCALAITVVVLSALFRFMSQHTFTELPRAPSPIPEDNTLPIAATANGELVFEAEILYESDSDES